LYETTFHVRADRDLLREVIELVGEQPDLMEATALLAKLYARTGDGVRADLFARLALESPNPTVRAKATEVLQGSANDAGEPPSSRVQGIISSPGTAAPPDAAKGRGSPPPSALDTWFERARREMVHRRTPMYGVRAVHSTVEALLDLGKTVALGGSFISQRPLPLTRAALAEVDEVIMALRRQHGPRVTSRSDTSRTMAAAGFFLCVVLHELDANVFEIAADDGACKVVLASGAGTRPLLVATAFASGTGPSFVQTFDRLAAALDLASMPPGEAPHGKRGSSGQMVAARPPSSGQMVAARPPSSGQMVAARPVALSARPSSPPTSRDELALSRPDVEANPLRRLERPMLGAPAPLLNLSGIASTLATSPLGQDVAERTGVFLAPIPSSIEALDSYCLAARGEMGEAPALSVWQPPDADEDLILSWGAFLGESLIAAYGGVWECDPNAPSDPRLFRVVCEDRVVAWPMTQVYLRLKNGSRHRLIDFVLAVGELLK
jgi:hypothetical protein